MTPDTPVHLELYLRSETPQPTTDRLAALRSDVATLASDHGWSFGVTHWPTKVTAAPTEGPESVVEHVFETFTAWADSRDVSLKPAFQTRRCYSWDTAEPYVALVLPVACLAVIDDDELRAVYPHRDGPAVRTIVNAISRLRATGELPVVSDGLHDTESLIETAP